MNGEARRDEGAAALSLGALVTLAFVAVVYLVPSLKRFRSNEEGGEGLEMGLGILPGGRGEAHFLRAETGQQLLLAPAGFAGHLGQEAAVALVESEEDAVVERVEIQGGRGWAQGENEGDFDVQEGQFIGRDRIVGETRILQDSRGHLLDGTFERLVGIQPPDAAAEAVSEVLVEGDEGTGGLEQGRIVGGGVGVSGEGGGTQGLADGLAGQVQEGTALVGGQVHEPAGWG